MDRAYRSIIHVPQCLGSGIWSAAMGVAKVGESLKECCICGLRDLGKFEDECVYR